MALDSLCWLPKYALSRKFHHVENINWYMMVFAFVLNPCFNIHFLLLNAKQFKILDLNCFRRFRVNFMSPAETWNSTLLFILFDVFDLETHTTVKRSQIIFKEPFILLEQNVLVLRNTDKWKSTCQIEKDVKPILIWEKSWMKQKFSKIRQDFYTFFEYIILISSMTQNITNFDQFEGYFEIFAWNFCLRFSKNWIRPK